MLHRLRFVALLLTAAPVIGLLGGCATDQKVIAQANDVNGTLQPAFITQADVAGYVQKVGDRIVDAARVAAKDGYKDHNLDKSSWMFKDIQFHLVNSETLNAFTTGGEHVYLYSQLFQDVDSEDAFAAVVAHEFAHIYGRHVQSGMNRQLLTLAAAAGAGATAYALAPENSKTQYATGVAGATAGVGQFLGMGFTRGDEAAADEMGFHFYVLAGYDPQKFADFFKTMIAKGYDTSSAVTSDHPTLSSRVQAAEERAAALPADASQYRRPDIATPQQFRRYQQEAAAVAKTTPNDKSLQQAQTLLAAFPSCVAPTETQRQQKARELLTDAADKMDKGK